ncbi:MAG: enoyl-CoA hydratase/isomerase family protein [Ectothiorhodospiraceae bacterium]|nr:enoyl-CoA hydratase/isomerase family protein [Ectothiorhodospiraceae bacterium]
MKYKEIVVSYDKKNSTVWLSMDAKHRQCFTFSMLTEMLDLLKIIDQYGSPCEKRPGEVKYLVVKSENSDIFNSGGDLYYFSSLVRAKDKAKLLEYATACIELVYWGLTGGKRNVTTIACVAGDAFGGGFETALACNYIIAEPQSSFAFPETLFGLFPGMGGYALFSRYVGSLEADRAISTGRRYSTEELIKLGAVSTKMKTGEAEIVTKKFIKDRSVNNTAGLAIHKLKNQINYNDNENLKYNIKIWVDAAMALTEYNLRKMETLIKLQQRKM